MYVIHFVTSIFSVTQRSTARRLPKSQVIIRRPPAALKSQPRAHLSDQITQDVELLAVKEGSTSASPMEIDAHPGPHSAPEERQEELLRIRLLLRPPPLPNVEDWGIPPESTEPADAAITVCLQITYFNAKANIHLPD